MFKQSGHLSNGDAVRAEVVPILAGLVLDIAGKLIDSCQCGTVLPIRPLSVFLYPAVLCVLLQLEAVGKIGDGIKEVRTVVAVDILAVVVGVQTVFDLILLLLCQGFEHMEMGINVVAQVTADRAVEKFVFIPLCIIRGDELNAAEDTKRICGRRIDWFTLLDKIADDRKLIALYLSRGQSEVLVCQAEIGGVDRDAFRCGQCDSDRRQRAYALCKLKQKIPRRASFLVAAGKHIQKCGKLLWDRHLGHIDRKGIGCFHIRLGINLIVGPLVILVVRV